MGNFDGINNYRQEQVLAASLPPRKKRRFWKWLLILLLIGGAIVLLGGTHILSKANQIFTNKQNIFTRFGSLFPITDDKPLIGEETGQVNILLLGMGGPGHDGPYLTDTMIVANINVKTSEVNLISIPRDFLVRLNGRGYNKINAAYTYGLDEDDPGSGGKAAIAVAEQVTGLTIPYFASIDFKGFTKAVDHVDGLDVTVDQTFTDRTYPDYRYGYLAPVTFTEGHEHMNGERALIFARSRHGNNGEGSDFSRSERQKKIMLAFKDKVLTLNLSNIGTLNNLLSDFTQNFRTNLEPHELKRIADMGKTINGENVYSLSLEPRPGLICDSMVDLATGRPAPPPVVQPEPETTDGEESEGEQTTEVAPVVTQPQINRAYVVTPCSGKTLTDVHQFLASSMRIAHLQKEQPLLIEIQNTTGKASATTTYRTLSDYGYEVKFTTSKTPLDRSVLYDNTKGAKPKTLEYLKSTYSLSVSDLPYTASQADFVIILGSTP
jgi:LCP family protein required for cell wall assembly